MRNRISGIIICGIVAVLSVALSSCGVNGSGKQTVEMEKTVIAEPQFEMITSHGTMKIRLYSKTPQHRDNFVKLVEENYYDGMRFHRVIEGFMIQGGDPNSKEISMMSSWGMGGPGYTVPAEFVSEYRHKKGAIAAARKGDMANPRKASSGSQFYIVQDEMTCAQLDGSYTVYGEVYEGLEVIDRIAAVDTDRMDRPYEDVMIVSVRQIGLPEAEAQVDSMSAQTAPADTTQAE